jgi:hypothetical protein
MKIRTAVSMTGGDGFRKSLMARSPACIVLYIISDFLRGPRGLGNHTINLFGFQPLPAIRAATSPAERWIGKA